MTAIHSRKRVNLALQGGGAHGAFTWGALDRLLEEERLDFDGISGTSAGAMNAAMLKSGWMRDRHAGARAQLDSFWGEIRSRVEAHENPWLEMNRWFWRDTPWAVEAMALNPLAMMRQAMMQNLSPYEWNPLNLNPLRELLVEMTDFDQICHTSRPHLFICATNVQTGKIRVFSGDDISVDAILASATLPQLFQAVQIGDDHFWDGGFMGNPPLYPLFYETDTRDVVIVHVNPIERPRLPRTAGEIEDRVNEISFNASLMGELRAVAFVRRLIAQGRMGAGEMRDVLIHSIRDDETMASLDPGSKLSPEPRLFDDLKVAGRQAADAFLNAHWGDIGCASSVDLRAILD